MNTFNRRRSLAGDYLKSFIVFYFTILLAVSLSGRFEDFPRRTLMERWLASECRCLAAIAASGQSWAEILRQHFPRLSSLGVTYVAVWEGPKLIVESPGPPAKTLTLITYSIPGSSQQVRIARQPGLLISHARVATLFVLSGLFPILMAWFFERRVLRPIRQLGQSVGQFAEGNWQNPLSTDRPNELEQLALQFNAMALEIGCRQRKLELVYQDKAQFLADTSHEFKSFLAVVQGQLQLLADGHRGLFPQQARETLTKTIAQTVALNRLLDDLLECSRLESGQFSAESEPFDLADCVEEALLQLEAKWGEVERANIFVAAGRSIWVKGDFFRTQQIILNLLENALKYAPGSPVQLEWQRPSSLVVADSGPGIPDSQRQLVFDAFTRLHPQVRSGMGLGLRIARQLAELQGGCLELLDHPGQGCRFQLTLPQAG